MRLNSPVENYRYKIVVVGSIPTVATKKSRSSIGRCIRLLTGGFWVRVPAGLQWMNSSTAEQRFVRPLVESSNLSSSAIVNATKLESRRGL
jgi:hypothetical protein